MRSSLGIPVFAAALFVICTSASAQFLVTVTHAGSGAGTTVSDPPGIQCPATSCSAGFTNGTMVSLTATPSAGSTFTAWSGACTGANPCVVTVDGSKAVTATFGVVIPVGTVRGDVNGDHKADLFWRQTGSGTGLSWWTMNGSSVLASNYFDVDPAWQVVDVADLDGDGNSDLIWRRTSDGAMYLWTLSGLAPTGFFDLGTIAPTEWSFAGVADLNGDGKGDIVWRRNSDGLIYAWLMDGGTIIGQGAITSAYGVGWFVAQMVDFDHNGKADLFMRRSSDGAMSLLYMDGLAITAAADLGVQAGPDFTLVAVVDFDGDGKLDYLWNGATFHDNWVWLLDGYYPNYYAQIYSPGDNWTIRAVADFDGDGRSDIAFHHPDGRSEIWFMFGLGHGAAAIPNPGSSWQIVGP